MSNLNDDDYRLSMRISARSKRGEREGLRSLLVHRLRPAAKAVGRVPLSGGAPSVYCEACDVWHRVGQWPMRFRCTGCARVYVVECAIYRALPEADETERTHADSECAK